MILKHKIECCRIQPIRYLVDYSAAYALVVPKNPLRSCIGIPDNRILYDAIFDESLSKRKNIAVRAFLQTCAVFLSRTRGTPNGTPNGVPAAVSIEMTINHSSGTVYGREVRDTMSWFGVLKYFTPARLVVIYKSPHPKIYVCGDTQVEDSSNLEKKLVQGISEGIEYHKHTGLDRRVFGRPLEDEAFKKHVEGLESY